jgi:TROVE domain-containing protein
MARFNQPTKTNTLTKTKTHEGGAGWTPDNPATELLFTAVVTYVGEDTFYESAETRTQRLVDLVHSATKRNPNLVENIARQLRHDFKIRTASILVACEYVAAGGTNVRKVIDSVCQRADEPGEVLAYWTAKYGRKIPRGIKTGLGDAARRLYNEFSALKYDTSSKDFRFGDVLELCHVKTDAPWQNALFQYVLDDRHHNDGAIQLVSRFDDNRLPMLKDHYHLSKVPEGERRALIKQGVDRIDRLADAGFTWEHLSSWLPGGMDAEAWEAVIPSMGVMALVRNLRNFDKANISNKSIDQVIARITDPEGVEKSRIFPYQVLLAYQYAQSDNWKRALGTTVDLASGNLPRLDGSLLVIDTSASMRGTVSAKSQADRITVASLQAAAIARHSRNCNVIIFGDTNKDITHEVRGRSVLGAADYINSLVNSVGSSTFGHTAIRDHFDPVKHKRAILFTDDQMHDSMDKDEVGRSASYLYQSYRHVKPADISHVPQVITFNIGGTGVQSTMGKGRITVAGFSDAIFNAVAKILQIETSEPAGTTV